MSKRLQSLETLGELKEAGYQVRSVKDELRENLIARLGSGKPVFENILGFEDTVIPSVERALLSKHNFILLGLRGQAKSRMIRMLPQLLDEFIPIIKGSDLNENPFEPVTKKSRELFESMGDDLPIDWLPRSQRFGEKLATPDTSIADLIGDIDPIKAATRKLTYADEEVIHFGIIPRINRGIFAINELPDLQARIQVGLLNIMEESDVQIRGFNVRIPLDILMVFTANPEDYTNRGSIITPLKDRIDSQILTHYPKTIEIGVQITDQEAWQSRNGNVVVHIPHFFREIIEQVAFEARKSEYIDQKSGVSVRLTRSALENLISSAEHRALRNNEKETTVRMSDLNAVETAISGKVELVYEGEQEGVQNVARSLIGRAVKEIFKKYFPDPAEKGDSKKAYGSITSWFSRGNSLELESSLPFAKYSKTLDSIDGLKDLVSKNVKSDNSAEIATMMEFVLEALHQHSMLGKEWYDSSANYRDLMGSMLSSLSDADFENDDLDFV